VNAHAEADSAVASGNHGNGCRGVSEMHMHMAGIIFVHPVKEYPCFGKVCQPLENIHTPFTGKKNSFL
jgi:hypothetical protein